MKKLLTLFIAILFSLSLTHAQQQLSEKGSYICAHKKMANPDPVNPLRSLNTPRHTFDVLMYTLNLDLYNNFYPPYSQAFTANETIMIRIDTSLNTIKLNAVNTSLQIQSVGDAGVSFVHTEDTLTISLDRTYLEGEIAEVSISYNHLNVEDGAFYVGGGFVFTDNEPEGARKWFPCYDRPYDKAKLNLTAKVPSSVLLGSNGRLADSTTIADTTWYHWVSRDPIATYLMVISARNNWNLDIVYWDRPSTPGEPMPIRFYYNDGENPGLMEQQVPLMADYFSDYYGEHPFEKDGFASLNDEFTWGGMENQTLTSICPGCWYESLICHEFAHQWFGDMISPGTWADLWLNEGFATWSESLWWERSGGYNAYKDDVENNASYYLSGNPGWPVYNPEWAVNTPSNSVLFNYAITYCKSACVLHLLRYSLGDDAFFNAIFDYAMDTVNFKYKNAVTDDFQAKIEESTGQDLDWFFDSWVKQPNHPVYENEYQIKNNGNGTWDVRFYVNQVQTNAGFFAIPIELFVYFTDNSDSVLRVMNEVNQQIFTFTFDKQPGIVFFDLHNEIVLKQASLTVGMDDYSSVSQPFSLEQNFPNPAVFQTDISFSLPESAMVDLKVYDLSGKAVLTILSAYREKGTHRVSADISRLSPGTYFYRLKAGPLSASQRMTVIR